MLIECKIKRADGTIVDMPNGEGQKPTRYHFKPLDARDADSPHVAEVSGAHASRFFKADADVYVPYEPTAAAAPPTLEPPAPTPPADGEPPAHPAEDDDEDEDGEHLTLKQLRAGIANGSLDGEKLRELLEAEQQADKPRKGFVDTIMAAIK